MNALKFWIALVALSAVTKAHAVVVDFNDIPSATYNVGNSFALDGIQFNVIGYTGTGAGSQIRLDGTSNDKRLSMGNSIGISVDLPANVGLISFEYFDFCGSCSTTGITVNGIASNPTVQLRALTGTSLGGASIHVVPGNGRSTPDVLTLTGPVTSFSTGGTEFILDNLRLSVPEPATGLLATCGMASFFLRRRK